MRATAPVRAGDTIHVRAAVLEIENRTEPAVRRRSTSSYDVLNQRDESVMNFHWVMLARRARRWRADMTDTWTPPYPEPGSANDAAFIGVGEIPSGGLRERSFMAQIARPRPAP